MALHSKQSVCGMSTTTGPPWRHHRPYLGPDPRGRGQQLCCCQTPPPPTDNVGPMLGPHLSTGGGLCQQCTARARPPPVVWQQCTDTYRQTKRARGRLQQTTRLTRMPRIKSAWSYAVHAKDFLTISENFENFHVELASQPDVKLLGEGG